jgi:hypothetical protein
MKKSLFNLNKAKNVACKLALNENVQIYFLVLLFPAAATFATAWVIGSVSNHSDLQAETVALLIPLFLAITAFAITFSNLYDVIIEVLKPPHRGGGADSL